MSHHAIFEHGLHLDSQTVSREEERCREGICGLGALAWI